jgi:hypothetical protein
MPLRFDRAMTLDYHYSMAELAARGRGSGLNR